MPVVSIIVPVYGVERYLSKCIDSILNQTFSEFELILVDDGSPDCCGIICDNYSLLDNRVKVIHQKNKGVSNARNTGIKYAAGDYIAFIDSDDYLKDDYLESLFNSIKSSEADCVTTGYNVISSDNQIKKVYKIENQLYCLTNEEEKYNFIIEDIFQGCIDWSIWTKLFKSSIIKEYDIAFCETCSNFAEDLGFFLAYIIHCKKIFTSDYVGYFYCERNGSMMNKSKNVVKMNELNEVSIWFFNQINMLDSVVFKKNYYVIHFFLIRDQFEKIIELKCFCLIPTISKTIQNYNWYKKNTIQLLLHYKIICNYIDKYHAIAYKNLCKYTVHRNRYLYKIDEFVSWRLK